jgi:GNAT superfamily N-acetyltransferase
VKLDGALARRVHAVDEVVLLDRLFAPRVVVAVPPGRRDVELLAAQKLHLGRQEVQLLASVLLVQHPGDVVLVGPEAGEGVPLERVDDLLAQLGRHARVLFRGEAQVAVRVAALEGERVDQLGGAHRVAPQHLGGGVAVELLDEIVAHGQPRGAIRREPEHHALSSPPAMWLRTTTSWSYVRRSAASTSTASAGSSR